MKLQIYLIQIYRMTIGNLKARYRNTIAGFIWVLASPLLTYGVQSLVFSQFLKMDVPAYGLFLLSGLLPWIFIVQSIEMSGSLFIFSGRLLKAYPIKPIVLICSQILDNFLNFIAAFIIVFVIAGGRMDIFQLLTFVAYLFLLVLGTLSITWVISFLNVFFRDLRFVVSFSIQILFYLTPIFYPVSLIPEKFQFLPQYNVIYYFIRPSREILYNNNLSLAFQQMGQMALIITVISGLGYFLWVRKKSGFYVSI